MSTCVVSGERKNQALKAHSPKRIDFAITVSASIST